MKKIQFNDNRKFGSDEWKEGMAGNGAALKKSNVSQVVFVHGTFTGNDAFGIFSFMEPLRQAFPQAAHIVDNFKKHSKHSVDKYTDDLGNFTEEYCKIFHKATGQINSDLFVWSGGNYHIARLRGMVKLVKFLADSVKKNNITFDDRMLLIGHSHAGQLFALLSIFLEDGATAKVLYKAVDKLPDLERMDLLENLLVIDGIQLDFVTFGTPVRYAWGLYNHYTLLSIINHRSLVQITGLLDVKDGDYVQQWGTHGSDMLPPPNEIRLNDTLDKVLDEGRNITTLISRLQRKRRVKAKNTEGKLVGHTVLVDYRDNIPDQRLFDKKSSIIKSIRTQFGHGVYTLKNAMLFNTDLIIEQLYSQ